MRAKAFSGMGMKELGYAVGDDVPDSHVIRAAAELLLDPNPRIHGVCATRLREWGPASQPHLVALAECDDPKARARVVDLLASIHRSTWLAQVCSDLATGGLELETGQLRLAQLMRPLLQTDRMSAQFDEWAEQLRPRVEREGTRNQARLLGRFFRSELHFRGDRRTYYDPANCLLDQVVSRRRGIPISLSSLYLLIGRRLGLPLEGVGLPGHFIVRLRGARSVLLDPFHDGRILTRQECFERLRFLGYHVRDDALEALSDHQMLLRTFGSLIHAIRHEDPESRVLPTIEQARRALLEATPGLRENPPDCDGAAC